MLVVRASHFLPRRRNEVFGDPKVRTDTKFCLKGEAAVAAMNNANTYGIGRTHETVLKLFGSLGMHYICSHAS